MVAAACGGDDGPGPGGDDGGGDDGPMVEGCELAVDSIESVPGTFSGTLKGKGNNVTVGEEGCTVSEGWATPDGEDAVIALRGLENGKKYGVAVTSPEDDLDIAIYISSACPTGGDLTAGCKAYADLFYPGSPELAVFTASGPEQYLIVDYSSEYNDDPASFAGNFAVEIVEAQCDPLAEESGCSGDLPACGADFACHECFNDYQCEGATPICGPDLACVAGPALCVNDDANDSGNGDDGPNNATMVAIPTTATPTVVTGKVCSETADESDWFKFTVPAGGLELGFSLSMPSTVDLDLNLFDSAGERITAGAAATGVTERLLADLDAGTYLLQVVPYVSSNGGTRTTTTSDYTLTLTIPECSPSQFVSTTCSGAEPVCSANGECVAGPSQCTGDDAGEPGDDAPVGARTLSSTALSGGICTLPRNAEFDWYKFTVTAGQGQTITLNWTGAADLDMYVINSTGQQVYGESIFVKPEVITLTNLPAGTYYVRVSNYIPNATTPSAAVQAYTITGATTPVVQCTNSQSCATEYKTQLYRSVCDPATDVCSFATATNVATGNACDSDTNCMSQDDFCSYTPYESDASKSVCAPSCDTTADCSAVAGTTCTSGYLMNTFLGPLEINKCVPGCATDLECGANQFSDELTSGQPWSYYSCDTTTMVCSGPDV